MRGRISTLAATAALYLALAPSSANAGPLVGFRTGVGFTGGKIEGSIRMADRASWTTPVQLEAGWRFGDSLSLTAFGTFSAGHLDSDYSDFCDTNQASCIIDQTRFGAQGQWSFMPGERFDPWFGLGVAREVLTVDYSSPASGTTTSLRGWDFGAPPR